MPLIAAFVVVCVIASVLWSMIKRQSHRRDAVERMRAAWGKAHDRPPGGRDPSLYHNLKIVQEEFWSIDDQTWEDLYLTSVFRAVDHTRSRPGSQMLYHLLRTPSLNAAEVARRDRLADLFAAKPELREKMQAAIDELENDDAGLLANLFLTAMPPRPDNYLMYPALTALSLASIAYTVLHLQYLPYLLPVFLANLLVSQNFRKTVQPWVQPLRVLNSLVSAAGQVDRLSGAQPSPDLEELVAPLRENRDALRVLDGATRWLLLERDTGSGMMGAFVEYGNMILLLDVNSFLFSMEAVRRQRQLIRIVFETIGKLDALIAIASYRHSLPGYCVPVFGEPRKRLRIEEALHPLLPRGVANSLALEDRSILVTGSNMSGKTTFIRTVAVNTVLAQTIATCLARRYEAPLVRVESSIGRSDSLAEGKSYYMAEVETIGEFLVNAAESTPYLFVIDEIYRGTNTTERVAASKAVLDALNRPDGPHIVLVSTHDIELSYLLQTAWDRYHFQESVRNGELAFDYTIRTGLCSSRNALRLLAAKDYPAAVVADAEATAARIDIVGNQTAVQPADVSVELTATA